MSDLLGRLIPGLDPLTSTFTLPLWTAGALAALFAVFCILAFERAGREGMIGGLARVALVLIGVSTTWFVLEGGSRQDAAAERRSLMERAGALAARATMPGSSLACLDGGAGDTVEGSCERALFATPESAAAAVSHVAAQLELFAEAGEFARRGNGEIESALAGLRRAIETDRYGLVAHVLATRHGCTIEQCPAVALMHDAQRVNANLARHAYALYVARHSGGWPPAAPGPVARAVPVTPAVPGMPAAMPGAMPGMPASASAFAARPGAPEIFLPSAASIPPVSIMNPEPAAEETTGSSAPPPARTPPRRPPQAQPKQVPMDLNAAARSAGAPPAAQ